MDVGTGSRALMSRFSISAISAIFASRTLGAGDWTARPGALRASADSALER
jgi:hypothetical protein